ncbi:MAG: molybdopterin-dependent oxidoreductase [Actinomycetota bacterium]|nr:molybdopterin-dependent oxidoreductase [Actinomycetota bacterium]
MSEAERRPARAAGAAAGLVGTGVAVAMAAIVSTVVRSFPFPVLVVAERVASLAPGKVASFFIDTFQHKALPLTVIGTAAALLIAACLLGMLLPWLGRRLAVPIASVVLAAPLCAAGIAAFRPSDVTVGTPAFATILAACAVVGAAAAARVFTRLAAESGPRTDRELAAPAPEPEGPRETRRAFLNGLWLGGAGIALGWAQLGRVLFPRPDPGREPLRAADVATVPPPPGGASDAAFAGISQLAPLITPNAGFYVVDEEIIDPDVDAQTWRLSVGGVVDRPFELTYDELLGTPAIEQYTTFECISNPIGGDLISNAKWTGVPLRDLLGRAGVRPEAVEVVSRSIGGYSDSIPIEDAMRPDALVAIGMNGQTLPRAHGFPARLVVPGYYGMKQPKWLIDIEVVDRPYRGYWEARGWVKAAVVKTMSRIDTVAQVAGGWTVAGVAFAGDRGISKVEVSLDGGTTWREATLETAISKETWRRWRLPFDRSAATSVVVRAVDGDGVVQTSSPADPHPSGASGYQEVGL